jgi:steroid 5-alpha reductase family enzyme
MRHPNYSAEQGIWIVFYFFSVAATGLWVNWSIAGALLLVLLFKGSSDFSEGVSAEKYPMYKKYQEQVGRFLPIKGRFKG